jgi:hypothetical protein
VVLPDTRKKGTCKRVAEKGKVESELNMYSTVTAPVCVRKVRALRLPLKTNLQEGSREPEGLSTTYVSGCAVLHCYVRMVVAGTEMSSIS